MATTHVRSAVEKAFRGLPQGAGGATRAEQRAGSASIMTGSLPTRARRRLSASRGTDGVEELGASAHAVAVAPDVHDVASVKEPVEKRGGHDVVAVDATPLLEVLVGVEHGCRSG